MKKVWLTYAWKDNEDKNIDFIIQELDKAGLDVKFDRRNLIPGQRLWTQVGGIINNSSECDVWGIVLTPNSIKSQPCIEELSIALDRALSNKGAEFPIFALLHNVRPSEMPHALKIRLCIPIYLVAATAVFAVVATVLAISVARYIARIIDRL